MKTNNRLIICIKDIQLVTGKSERTAKRIMKAIKSKHRRNKREYITRGDLCEHLHLEKEEVSELLG
ncbi:MAG: hypothetical protein ABIP30_16710 [Ferruginibacter sp.]